MHANWTRLIEIFCKVNCVHDNEEVSPDVREVAFELPHGQTLEELDPVLKLVCPRGSWTITPPDADGKEYLVIHVKIRQKDLRWEPKTGGRQFDTFDYGAPIYGLRWIDDLCRLGYGVVSIDLDPVEEAVRVLFSRLDQDFFTDSDLLSVDITVHGLTTRRPSSNGHDVFLEVVAPWTPV